MARTFGLCAALCVCAAAAYAAVRPSSSAPTPAPQRSAAPVQLQYTWDEGSQARVTTRIEGMGMVREAGAERRMTMWAETVAREQVDRVGPGGDATVTTLWESATFNMDGQRASLAPRIARLEKRVGRSGKVYWARERGRESAARQGAGSFTIDTRQLALLDLLVEQVQYLRLPAEPVGLNEKWPDMERVETEDVRGYMSKMSEIVSMGGEGGAGTCSIRSSLTAPLELVFAADDLLLRGKVTGDITQSFDVTRGRLNGATGTLSVDLRAPWQGEAPPPATAAPPQTAGTEAPGIQDDDDGSPFVLRMQFEVRVKREPVAASGK